MSFFGDPIMRSKILPHAAFSLLLFLAGHAVAQDAGAESGVRECVVNSWYGALVPAKTSPAVCSKLHAAFAKVLQMPEVKERLFAQGAEATPSASAEFELLIRDELKQWEFVIRDAGIKPE